jgi:hypothetical protein
MAVCIFVGCHGHDDKLDAILHGQQHLAAEVATIKRALRLIETREGNIMGIAEDILAAENAEAAAVAALGTAVDTAVATLTAANAQIADLIANGSLSDDDKAALQSTLDAQSTSTAALGASLAEVNAALNPPPAE